VTSLDIDNRMFIYHLKSGLISRVVYGERGLIRVRVMVFNTTFNNISVISWRMGLIRGGLLLLYYIQLEARIFNLNLLFSFTDLQYKTNLFFDVCYIRFETKALKLNQYSFYLFCCKNEQRYWNKRTENQLFRKNTNTCTKDIAIYNSSCFSTE